MRSLKIFFIIVPVLLILFSCGKEKEISERQNDGAFALADSLTLKALYDSSNKVIMPQLEKFLADGNYESYIDAVNRVAANFRKVANYDSAFAYVTKAIEISESKNDTVNLHIAQTYYLLGLMYRDYQIKKEALLYLKKSLKIRQALLPENDPLIGDVFNNLGVIFYNGGELDKGLDYFKKALAMRKQRGFYDKSVGSTYMNLGNIYGDMNKSELAIAYFDTALTIQKKVYKKEHPAIGSIYLNLAANYGNVGELDSSLAYYKRALKIFKNVFGENHPLVASVYNNIGLYYFSLGDYENAVSFYTNSLKIKKELGTKLRKEIIDNYVNIGLAYRLLKKHDASIKAFEKARKIVEDEGENLNPFEYAKILNGMSLTYLRSGDNKRAFESITKALEIVDKFSDANSFEYFSSKIYLSKVFANLGEYEKSISNSKECVEFFHRANMVRWLVFSYELLAEAYLRNGEFEKALAAVDSLKAIFDDGAGRLDVKKIQNYSNVSGMITETLGMSGQAALELFYKTKEEHYLDKSKEIYLTIIKLFSSDYTNLIVESSKISRAEDIKDYLKTGMKAAYEKFNLSRDDKDFVYALKLAEFGKALTVLENVKKQSAFALGKISKEETEKIASLQKIIGRYDRILSMGETEKLSEEERSVYERNLFNARMKYDELNRELTEKYPVLKNIMEIDVDISIGELRNTILDPDQSAIEYFVGDSELFALVITPDTVAVIKTNLPADFENIVGKLISAIENDERSEFINASRKIYEVAFKETDRIISTPRVLIINDGALGYIPYDILLYKDFPESAGYKSFPYLIRKYSIGYAYSFNLLKNFGEENSKVAKFLGVAPFSGSD